MLLLLLLLLWLLLQLLLQQLQQLGLGIAAEGVLSFLRFVCLLAEWRVLLRGPQRHCKCRP